MLHNPKIVRPLTIPQKENYLTILNDPEASPADLQLAEKKGKYEVVIGKRRWLSAKAKHIEPLDISIRPAMTNLEALEATLENDQHKDITDYERGKTYKTMLEKFQESFPTTYSIAHHLHRDQSTIVHCINHYAFISHEISKETMGCPIVNPEVTKLSETIVRTIRAAPEKLQPQLFEKAIHGDLTVREARIIADQTALSLSVRSSY